jgi:hypothetical protein
MSTSQPYKGVIKDRRNDKHPRAGGSLELVKKHYRIGEVAAEYWLTIPSG